MKPLDASQLYHACDRALFDFKTTESLEPLERILGQERAIEAIGFGAAIKQDGYNLFAMGPSGSGRHTAVMAFLKEKAQTSPAPKDWCYVNNFADTRKPIAIALAPGAGAAFRTGMEELVAVLRSTLPAVFESDGYRSAHELIGQKYTKRQDDIFRTLSEEAKANSIVMRNPAGGQISFAPLIEGKVLSAEEFQALPETEKKQIQEKLSAFEAKVKSALVEVSDLTKSLQQEFRALDRQTTSETVQSVMQDIRTTYSGDPKILAYLDAVKADVIKNAADFLQKPEEMENNPFAAYFAPSFERYGVNVVVSREAQSAAPLLYEDNPTLRNLLGDIEHMAQIGALVTNFTLIKPGALHRANGGYLVIDSRKLLFEPFAWEALKRVLRSKEIRIESPAEQYSLISSVTLEPEPIPLDIKIVLVGERLFYYLLYQYDPDFRELFKVAADFEDEMERNDETTGLYARMVASMAGDFGLNPLSADAVGRVIEQSSRYAQDAGKLSTHLGSLSDLLKEADFVAKTAQRAVIEKADIDTALARQRQRLSRPQDMLYARIADGTVMIRVSGSATGQVNGISVAELGGYAFGIPARITARTRMGKGQIIDIEREIKLGGPIHSKGILTLSAYLGSQYADKIPLSLTASLVFEQTYGYIEGDSASSAELYALLSSLSGLPIQQQYAVTGSVNQYGEVQAIGGVNEKIEGFFDICRRLDPDGTHGVIIPAANVKHLMLKPDVIDAVRNGTFAIYAVHTIDEGIEILTATPAGKRDDTGSFPPETVNGRIMHRLSEYAEAAKSFASQSGSAESGKAQ